MKKILFFVSVLACVMLASCSKTLPNPNEITVNPNPLEVVADKIEVEISGTFPAKEFAKKGVLEVTPVLKYNGKEAVGKTVVYVGEKSKENGMRVNFKNGGSYKQSASFAYNPEMNKSELYLRFKARNGKKEIMKEDLKIADGVLSTVKLVSADDNKPILSKDKFQRIIQEIQEADIKFLIQQANLRDSELRTQQLKDLQSAIKDANDAEKKAINKLEVAGYASPDGGVDLNSRLAKERQKNAQTYLERQMKRDKVESAIQSNITAEDWAGFKKAMEKSNIQDKELVLRVLSMYQDPEERETQIKNLSNVYKTIAEEVLPELRRSRLILTTDIIGKSDDEIKDLIKNDINQLSVEELLYGATLLKTRKQKIPVYQQAATKFKDYRAYNNLGVMYYRGKDYKDAGRYYGKALEIKPNDNDINFNMALVALAMNDFEKVNEYVGKAAGTKGNIDAVRGMLATLKGDYKAAQKAYGQTASNNAAIVQILNNDYATARKTLNNIKGPDNTTSYLKAVLAARTNDRQGVYTNLKKAVSKDKKLMARAKVDIEFAKFADDAEFKKIVK